MGIDVDVNPDVNVDVNEGLPEHSGEPYMERPSGMRPASVAVDRSNPNRWGKPDQFARKLENTRLGPRARAILEGKPDPRKRRR